MARRNQDFQTIRSEGGLLPPDLLRRVIDPKAKLEGTTPQDYGLPPGERLNEAITQSWNRLRKHWADFRAIGEEPAAGGGRHRPHQRQVERAAAAGTGVRDAADQRGARDRWQDLRDQSVLRCHGDSPDRLRAEPRSTGGRRARRGGREPARTGAGLPEPQRCAPVGDPVERPAACGSCATARRSRGSRTSSSTSRRCSTARCSRTSCCCGSWRTRRASRRARVNGPRPAGSSSGPRMPKSRARGRSGDLKQGVEKALEILGQGFVGHPKNTALRDALRTGTPPAAGFPRPAAQDRVSADLPVRGGGSDARRAAAAARAG